MQKLGSLAARKNIEPVVRTGGPRPFELPGFRVAEKVDFRQALLVCRLDGEIREELEWGAGGELGVVAGLEQKEASAVAGPVRRGDSLPADRQKEQPKPPAGRRSLGKQGVEALDRGVGAD